MLQDHLGEGAVVGTVNDQRDLLDDGFERLFDSLAI
jgi:hypothetical protein